MKRSKFCRFKFFCAFVSFNLFVFYAQSEHGQADASLLTAVQSNNLEKVGEILDSGDVKNINQVDGKYLLQIAFDIYGFNVARSLLQNGADPNVKVNHEGLNIPITEYIVKQLKSDKVGFGAVKLRMLLENHADFTQTSSPKFDIFNIKFE